MGFVKRFVNSWRIFKASFEFMGRDKSLFLVPLLMIIGLVVFIAAFWIGSGVLSEGGLVEQSGILVLVILLLCFFFMQFFSVFLASMQSWMVYEVALGKDATLASGFRRAWKNFWDILLYALVFFVVNIILHTFKEQTKSRLGQIGIGFLEVMVSIAGKLILPAMIVSERNFGQAVKQLRDALKALPEIGIYEVGSGPLFFVLFLIGVFVSYLVMIALGFWIGLLLLVSLIVVLSMMAILIDQIYYTLLYLTLIEKKKVKGLQLK